jgi:hypothetical protein
MHPAASGALLLALAAGVSPMMGQATSDRVPAGRVPPPAVAVQNVDSRRALVGEGPRSGAGGRMLPKREPPDA